jgi:hypothetical protein
LSSDKPKNLIGKASIGNIRKNLGKRDDSWYRSVVQMLSYIDLNFAFKGQLGFSQLVGNTLNVAKKELRVQHINDA